MADIDSDRLALLAKPQIRLVGHVDEAMYKVFRDQVREAPPDGPLVIAITTLGGDPEIARTMADDIRLLRECGERDILFLGKVAVYSAGATFMAGFPIANRYLTENSRIMIHERAIEKTIELSGPLRGALDKVTQLVHEIEQSIAIEEEGFRAIVKGSQVDFAEVREKAPRAWYLDCHEAVRLGLIAGVI